MIDNNPFDYDELEESIHHNLKTIEKITDLLDRFDETKQLSLEAKSIKKIIQTIKTGEKGVILEEATLEKAKHLRLLNNVSQSLLLKNVFPVSHKMSNQALDRYEKDISPPVLSKRKGGLFLLYMGSSVLTGYFAVRSGLPLAIGCWGGYTLLGGLALVYFIFCYQSNFEKLRENFITHVADFISKENNLLELLDKKLQAIHFSSGYIDILKRFCALIHDPNDNKCRDKALMTEEVSKKLFKFLNNPHVLQKEPCKVCSLKEYEKVSTVLIQALGTIAVDKQKKEPTQSDKVFYQWLELNIVRWKPAETYNFSPYFLLKAWCDFTLRYKASEFNNQSKCDTWINLLTTERLLKNNIIGEDDLLFNIYCVKTLGIMASDLISMDGGQETYLFKLIMTSLKDLEFTYPYTVSPSNYTPVHEKIPFIQERKEKIAIAIQEAFNRIEHSKNKGDTSDLINGNLVSTKRFPQSHKKISI